MGGTTTTKKDDYIPKSHPAQEVLWSESSSRLEAYWPIIHPSPISLHLQHFFGPSGQDGPFDTALDGSVVTEHGTCYSHPYSIST